MNTLECYLNPSGYMKLRTYCTINQHVKVLHSNNEQFTAVINGRMMIVNKV